MKIRVFALLTISLFLSCFAVACNEANGYEGAEVSIVSTTTETRSKPNENKYTKWAIVKYTIENIGTKTLYGWAVSFNVSFQIGPQLRTSHNVYCTIEPGNVSTTQTTSFLIPSNHQNATGTVLNYIETW
jgi:hypothetical protein